ncbi:hypothetical protein [Clostridium saccharoperbutylacetonicum]
MGLADGKEEFRLHNFNNVVSSNKSKNQKYINPPRGIYSEYEVYQKFVDMWKASPTEETYKKILELAGNSKEWCG